MPTQVLDASGAPIPSQAIARMRTRALMGPGMGSVPWEAADYGTPEMGQWTPWLLSPDVENSPYRDRLVARTRDLVRNDGYASGAVTRIADNVVGAELRPIPKPDWRSLALVNKAYDSKWAEEFAQVSTALYRTYADDVGCWCDIHRKDTLPQIFYTAFRHVAIDGEAVAMLPRTPDRVGPGRAHYNLSVDLIDPDRLSNPHSAYFDWADKRRGVEIDAHGAPVAYHFRCAHQGDYFMAAQSVTWRRVPFEDSLGRVNVVHYFETSRAGTHTGIPTLFAPVLGRLRMLGVYDSMEVRAAIVNSYFSAWVESPYDPQSVLDNFGGDDQSNATEKYFARIAEHHETIGALKVGEQKMPILYPGEKINALAVGHPATNFGQFQAAVLRNLAAALGISYEQLSQDWSQTNYSSARAALLESWKTTGRRRLDFVRGFAHQIWTAWLEEAFFRKELPLPSSNVVPFINARTAYARARWMGPARGYIDPVKEAEAEVLRINNQISTRTAVCAEQGRDVDDVFDELANEDRLRKEKGLAPVTVPPSPTAETRQTPAQAADADMRPTETTATERKAA